MGELENEKRWQCPSGKGKREAMRPGIVVRRMCRVPLMCGGSVGPSCRRATSEGGGQVSNGARAVRAGAREERASTSHDAWLRPFYVCTARDLTPAGGSETLTVPGQTAAKKFGGGAR
jgi:hypothetical protein